jgi:hypothetical protein
MATNQKKPFDEKRVQEVRRGAINAGRPVGAALHRLFDEEMETAAETAARLAKTKKAPARKAGAEEKPEGK